ncbi:type II CAAX endopeptidase family protein [Streptococcus pneumoniae]
MTKHKLIMIYSGIAFLLFFSQFGVQEIMALSFIRSLSDTGYFIVWLLLTLLQGVGAIGLLYLMGESRVFCRFEWKFSYLGATVGTVILMYLWWNLAALFLPLPQNQARGELLFQDLSGTAFFIQFVLNISLFGPICEELVYRALLMTSLKSFQEYYLDVLLSSVLFSLMHVLPHGWSFSSFIIYLGGGLLFAALYRKTKSIYYPIMLHIAWNSFVTLLQLTMMR